jgi:hypothetical protein
MGAVRHPYVTALLVIVCGASLAVIAFLLVPHRSFDIPAGSPEPNSPAHTVTCTGAIGLVTLSTDFDSEGWDLGKCHADAEARVLHSFEVACATGICIVAIRYRSVLLRAVRGGTPRTP